jgi:hypothetical protein
MRHHANEPTWQIDVIRHLTPRQRCDGLAGLTGNEAINAGTLRSSMPRTKGGFEIAQGEGREDEVERPFR